MPWLIGAFCLGLLTLSSLFYESRLQYSYLTSTKFVIFTFILSAYTTNSLISMKSSTPVYKLLRAEKSDVAELVTHARQLGHFSGIVQAMLDTSLADHCHLAHFDGSRMVIVADSPAWANRLRFSVDTLLSQLKQYSNKFHALSKIEVAVRPQLYAEPQPGVVERTISVKSAQYIEECADAIEDPALKQALHRLARRQT